MVITCFTSLTHQFIEAGISGIHHPAEHVRKVAERILLLIYKNQPRLVRLVCLFVFGNFLYHIPILC